MKHVIKLTFFYTLFIISSIIFPSELKAEDQIVKVGIYENSPKVFTSKSGKPSGIFIDIIEYIAKNEEWKLQYVSGSWEEGLSRLEKGEIDLMPDVAYTADREKIFSFTTESVLSSWSQVYTRKGSKIRSLIDLSGKKITVLQGSIQQEAFTQLNDGFGLKVTLIPVDNYDKAFKMVAQNESDGVICNNFYGLLHIKEYGLIDTAVIFSPAKLMFAAPKNRSVDLLTDIDRNLIKLKNDPLSIYYKSLKQWTSDDIKFELPLWMKIFALILAIILFMSLFGSIILKRQVNVRTMQLRQINKEIEQRIIERTSQLQDTNKKLSSEIDERKKSETLLKQTFEELTLAKESAESADRLKSAFLATMSHELRTPLNSIIGFTGIILQGIVGDLNDEQKKQLNMVKTSAQHLLALINDILDISKIEAGQLQIVNENYNLREIIEKVTETTRPLATQKGLEITCSISPEIGSIEGDRRRVEQILLNLISNAIKFTEKGSVKIDCQTEKDSLILSVTDTGIGIKQNDIETICIPFRQIDTGLTRKYEGTGLGLSICKKLVELMDGYLWISSVYGEGSVFSFSLPNKRSDK